MDKFFDFSEEVSKGIDLMDRLAPESWRKTFHGEYHDMTFMMTRCHCILGVVFGDYFKGLDYLQISPQEEYEYGFCIPNGLIDDASLQYGRYDAWVELGREWLLQLDKEDNS